MKYIIFLPHASYFILLQISACSKKAGGSKYRLFVLLTSYFLFRFPIFWWVTIPR